MGNKIEKIVKDWWNSLEGSGNQTLPSPRLCDINEVEKLIDAMREEAKKQLDYKFAMVINAPNQGTKDWLLGQCTFIEEFFNLEKGVK